MVSPVLVTDRQDRHTQPRFPPIGCLSGNREILICIITEDELMVRTMFLRIIMSTILLVEQTEKEKI